jgi:hypothetical protein
MTFRRRIMWIRLAIGVVLIISALSTASAQANRQSGPPYRPAVGAKDLRAVLFNRTWTMGMVRGLDKHELVASLEYHAHHGSRRGTSAEACVLRGVRAGGHILPDSALEVAPGAVVASSAGPDLGY